MHLYCSTRQSCSVAGAAQRSVWCLISNKLCSGLLKIGAHYYRITGYKSLAEMRCLLLASQSMPCTGTRQHRASPLGQRARADRVNGMSSSIECMPQHEFVSIIFSGVLVHVSARMPQHEVSARMPQHACMAQHEYLNTIASA